MKMETLEDEFGDIIQKARTGLGLTTRQVADMAGLTVSIIGRYGVIQSQAFRKEAGAVAGVLGLNPGKLYAIAAGLWHPEEPPEQMSDVITIDGANRSL